MHLVDIGSTRQCTPILAWFKIPLIVIRFLPISCLEPDHSQPRVLHAHQLPFGSSPWTKSYSERSALIPLVTSQTAFRIVEWPQKSQWIFSTCFVLTRTLSVKLLIRSSISKLLSQARLTVEFLWFGPGTDPDIWYWCGKTFKATIFINKVNHWYLKQYSEMVLEEI